MTTPKFEHGMTLVELSAPVPCHSMLDCHSVLTPVSFYAQDYRLRLPRFSSFLSFHVEELFQWGGVLVAV